jgi:elongation factor P
VSYETLTLGKELLGDATDFLLDGQVVQILLFNGHVIGLQMPQQVELAVTYTEPGIRGNTAAGNVTKAATLETGVEVRVPLYIETGEKVRVHTETREFMGRA